MRRLLWGVACWICLLATGQAQGPPFAPPPGLTDREIYQPQLLAGSQGQLLLIWREAGDRGSNLFAAFRHADRLFSQPVQLNAPKSTVESVDLDEIRAAVAIGSPNRVAVAWGGDRGSILAVVSVDGGRSFQEQVRLNQDSTPAYRGFPAIAFDVQGDLHAVWIDARFAPRGAEEPADLFYAKLSNGIVTEKNLTEEQESSICGCCRPHLEITDSGEIFATFRNTTSDGFRDIFRIEGHRDGRFGNPVRFGPPMWELNGCPMAGPVGFGKGALWLEASTGKRRLLKADSPEPDFAVLLKDEEDRQIQRPPRLVQSFSQDASTMILIPGYPDGVLMEFRAGQWTRLPVEVPSWATSALLQDSGLLVVGTEGRKLKWTTVARPASFQ